MPYFIVGNLWLLVALALFVGRTFERGSPTRYSFFGVGGWLSPFAYGFLIVVTAAVGVFSLMVAYEKMHGDS